MTTYVLLVVFLCVGLYGLLAKRSLVKKILGLVLLEHAANLFLILIGYRAGGVPPILLAGERPEDFVAKSVDPLPQALVLTAIVIGLGVAMVMVALALRIGERHGTLDSSEVSHLRG